MGAQEHGLVKDFSRVADHEDLTKKLKHRRLKLFNVTSIQIPLGFE